MKSLFQLAGLLLALFVFTGCVNKEEIQNYETYNMGGNASTPTAMRLRVIVVGIDDEHNNKAAGDLGSIATGRLEPIIRDSGAQNVSIGRGLRSKLREEFEIIERSGGISEYSSPKEADIALKGSISSAIITAKYSKDYYILNPANGRNENQGPTCEYIANIKGTMRVFKVNPVKELESFDMDESTKYTPRARGSACPTLADAKARQLFQEATVSAIDTQANKVKNLMASRGSVLSARISPDGDLFYRLSITPSAGAKPGVDVEFIKRVNRDGFEEVMVLGEGTIACTPQKTQVAWAELKTEGAETKIQKGTEVKLRFSEGLLDKAGGMLGGLTVPGFGCE